MHATSERLETVCKTVVGRDREVAVVLAALAAGRNVVLEGPPGTGKTTLLRAIADSLHTGFVFVEGNAELTPARLAGSHDPARVLTDGYVEDAFVDGPLVTVMSERELSVPRLGRVAAHPDFRLVAAMNPFDAVGTARISSAIYDRTCRVTMEYQGTDEELEIVQRTVIDADGSDPDERRLAATVDLVRSTRSHHDIRQGASVRGATDMELIAQQLARLQNTTPDDRSTSLDAALAALSGRIRLHEGTGRTAEEVVAELWDQAFDQAREPGDDGSSRGKATAP